MSEPNDPTRRQILGAPLGGLLPQAKVGRTTKDSEPWWPAPVRAPRGAPNVLWIVIDDMGFGHISPFGGPIESPNLERLARGGLRFTNFHTTALCSPTRAALLTGRNHHSVGLGVISEMSTGYPGYNGYMPPEKAMLPEILAPRGYSTFAVGKWHLTPSAETTPAGPFDRWPLGRGFEHFYGFLRGETDQYHPDLVEDNRMIDADLKGKHLTTALADKAIHYLQDHLAVTPEKPFLLYWAPGATHAPIQAPREWMDKFRGKFDRGWDKVREETLVRQKQLGIIPPDAQLPPREPGVKAWDVLSADEKRLFARMNEAFAGYASHLDYEIGRLIQFLESRNLLDNTIVVVNVGDNGASQEGGVNGTYNDVLYFNGVRDIDVQESLRHFDQIGTEMTASHYPLGWAMAGNTPFRRYKRDASNEGGTRNPFIAHWPARIKDRGGLRSQYHHAIDVMPTLLEAIGIDAPAEVKGCKQAPIEGVSMLYSFDDPKARSRRTTQYYEMFSKRAIYKDGWKALAYHVQGTNYELDKWELYNFEKDFNELKDLAGIYPSMVKEMQAAFDVEARKYNVYPLDDSTSLRFLAARPRAYGNRKVFTYYPDTVQLPNSAIPRLTSTSYSITANVEMPESGGEGVLLAVGGRMGGIALYVQDGKLAFTQNLLLKAYNNIISAERVPAGKSTLRFDFAYAGGKPGAGGTGSLFIDGRKVAEEKIPQTPPLLYNIAEGLDIGRDRGTGVTERYKSPFAFTGKLHKVIVELK